MNKITEYNNNYLAERIEKAQEYLEEVCREYIDNGSIEEVDASLFEAFGLVTLVSEQLKKLI